MYVERPRLTSPDRSSEPLEQPRALSAEEMRAAHFEGRIPTFRSLRALWREDRQSHRGTFFSPGFQALAVHRYGVWARGLRSRLATRIFRRLYFIINWIARSFHGIELPPKTRIGRRTRIAHQGGIVLHMDCSIGGDCLIRHNVTIGVLRDGPGMKAPRIGNRVEIGAGAVILGDITIGDDAVIGANVVVRKDVPAKAIVLPPEPTVVLR